MNTESGFCYIVIFSNGFIKGGKSGDIFKRYKVHKTTAVALGISVKQTFYTEPHSAYHANEKRLLSALAAVSEERVGEFFRGATEDSAIEALCSLGLGINLIEECIFGISKNVFDILAAYRLTGETYSVLLYLMSKVSFDNWINVTQAEIGNNLGLAQQNVSRAMKVLVEKKIIMEGPRKGRCHTYRLNYAVGYKGDEGRQTKGGFKILDGGKKKDGTPAFKVVDENGYVIPPKPAPKDSKPSAPDSEPG
jgi:CRP-like cAMP-binding protein